MSPADHHREVAADFGRRVDGVVDWDVPAPVEGWRARDVVGHLVGWSAEFLASRGYAELPPGPSVADDPTGAWNAHVAAMQGLLESDAAAVEVDDPHLGHRVLGELLDSIYTADVFLHTWDLARATGQDETLDPDTCAAMFAGMQPIEDLLRGSGQYGPRVPVPSDADAQTQLLGFIGRDPDWTSPHRLR